MLQNIFFTFRPIFDGIGVMVIVALCSVATLYAIYKIIKIFYKFFIALGVVSVIIFFVYIGTDGFSFVNSSLAMNIFTCV